MISIDFHYDNANTSIMELDESKVICFKDRGEGVYVYVNNKDKAREIFTEVAKMLAMFEEQEN